MSTESIKDLREEFDDGAMEPHLIRLLDRLEAAEARVAELQQLMAEDWSRSRKHEHDATSRWAEVYRVQCILDGTPTKYPHMTAGPEPVDDVSSLLVERLERDAARIKELEAAQQPRPMADAPRDTDIMLTIGARYRGDEDEPYRMGLLGWLPLPDREDSPESPGIGASGKTES
jgi:site-specific recombinase